MKGLCLGMVDGGHIAFSHEANNIHIDVSIDILFEYDFLALSSDFVESKLDLSECQYMRTYE